MYIRRKRAFRELVGLLRRIEADPDDIQAVRELNLRLVDLVKNVEQSIAGHMASKKELRRRLKVERPSKVEASELRRKIKLVDGYIRAQKDQIYVWKCFGDSLAFIFVDPFSIKQMFFDTAEYQVKQDSGSMSGKSGLVAELSVLEGALTHGVPAVLCDLTNTLRYGDVCLLGASDPHPIEVKATSRLNQRGKRQKAKLEKLHEFLENDKADNFRGLRGTTKRVASDVLHYHDQELNCSIIRAQSEGYAICTPEDGFSFVCINTKFPPEKRRTEEIFSKLKLESPDAFDLNEFKNGHAWAFYLPFLLTIRDPEHILGFLEGRIYILVFLEGKMLARRFEQDGWEVRYKPGDQYPIQCLHSETGAYYGVSSQFMARAAFEFLSFDAIVSLKRLMPANLKEIAEKAMNAVDASEFRERLTEQLGEDDEWIERILSAQARHTKRAE